MALLICCAAAARQGLKRYKDRHTALPARGRRALVICLTGLVLCQHGTGIRPSERTINESRRMADEEAPRSRPARLLRSHVRKVIGQRGLSVTARGFLAALLLADRSALDPVLRERWRRLGIAHFLALSGLHLGIIVLPLYRLLALARLGGALREAAVVMVLSLYAAIALAPLSLLRALSLLCVVRFQRLCGRKCAHDEALVTGVLIVCLCEPRAATDPGFMLSVAATAGVILVGLPSARLFSGRSAGRTERVVRWTAAALCVSLSAYMFTLPLSVRIFGRAPLVGPLLSILIAPLFTGLLYAGFLYVAGFYLLGGISARVLNLIAGAVTAIPSRAPAPNRGAVVMHDFSPACYAAGLAVLTLALARGAKRTKTALAGIAVIAVAFMPLPRTGRTTQTHAADTVAAGAILVGSKRLLIVDGPLDARRASHIARILWRRGVRSIEWAVILDAGCASRTGAITLDEYCDLRRIFVSPWMLLCGGSGADQIDARLTPVAETLLIDTGRGVYLLQGPGVCPGARRSVTVEEAGLRISALDSDE